LSDDFFSADYFQARHRFRQAVEQAGGQLESHRLAQDHADDLTVDVGTIGPRDAATVVLSSGLHGVEGFLGSAVQLSCLADAGRRLKSSLRYVFVHAINPFGFTHLRRFNEDNIDLNRNFHDGSGSVPPAPDGYERLAGLLNPPSPPTRWEAFPVKAAWVVLRHGMAAVQRVVASGQLVAPRGLFYAGDRPAESTRLVRQHCRRWIGDSRRVVHLDLHSGLGNFGQYKLLLHHARSEPDADWYRDCFGADVLELAEEQDDDGAAAKYQAIGQMGVWLARHFRDITYRHAVVEYGTYPPIRVLAALREENRLHHYNSVGDARRRQIKRELLECFCPESRRWREMVIESARRIVAQAETGIQHSGFN